jgi:predicted Zn-dependent peptidase
MDEFKAQMYLDKVFSNPSDYTMIIVGDYDKQALLQALKIYIASIPCQGQFLEKEFSAFEFPENITEVSVESASLKDESTCVMTFPLKTDKFVPKFESYFCLELLKNLLTRRCLESLRMLEGQTYGVHLSSFFPFYPAPQSGRLIVNFSCQKDKEQLMKNLILEQIKKAQVSCFSQEELDKAFEIYKHQYARSLLTLEGLKEKVEQNSVFHHTFDVFLQDQVLEEKPTAQKLQHMLCDLVDLEHYSVCTRRPVGN